MTPAEQDEAVLAYHVREARGVPETLALAGLKLAGFKLARARLVEQGRLYRTTGGRHAPVEERDAR